MKLIKSIREPVNALTHGFGAVASLIALILMVSDSWSKTEYSALLASWVFGISMILLYSSSSIYHWVKGSDSRILWLKKIDHMMIFILIAGTYTPYCIIALPNTMGWITFSLVWAVAIAGIFIKLFWIHAPRWISTGIYLGMGWFAVTIFPSMNEQFGTGGFLWLGIGGLAYTIGAIIYALKKPDPFPLKFGFHEIWHIFVLIGTFSHFASIFIYVLPISH